MNVQQSSKEIAVRVLRALGLKATEQRVQCVAGEVCPELTRAVALQFADCELLALDYVAEGLCPLDIAARLNMKYKTVLKMMDAMRAKFGVACNTKMIEKARDLGLVEMKCYEKNVLSIL